MMEARSPKIYRQYDGDWGERNIGDKMQQAHNIGTHYHIGDFSWWLCKDGADEWWDLSNARAIEIVITSEPNGEGYECELSDGPGGSKRRGSQGGINIRGYGDKGWQYYDVFVKLSRLIDQVESSVFYMSINVLEERKL